MVLGADWLAGQWLEFGDGLLALGLSAEEGLVAPAVHVVPGVVVLSQGLVVPGDAVGAWGLDAPDGDEPPVGGQKAV